MKKELGKIIRDSVHGDIFIENKYMKVINTREFQRLRRIKQLSIGNLVFPSAEHTRFSHSIGTFYLMEKIINHITNQLKNINIKIQSEDRELALLVALLHDIGHGPFSHAFECISDKHHEEWTCDIILGETEINKVLKDEFGDKYPEKIVGFLREKDCRQSKSEDIDLFFVIKSLISSQLDADRMDYLVRDSQTTGVVFGDIDLSRIINSIRITEYNDEIYVCIQEKNKLDIKSYLLARDNMHSAVYFHATKCELERIIELIFIRCKELKEKDNNFEKFIPRHILPIINDDINLEQYLYLDDSVIITFFKELLDTDDFILKMLCYAILERKKFSNIEILDNSKENIEDFINKLNNIISTYNKDYNNKDQKYFFIKKTINHKPYKKDKENIYVLCNNGTIKDISETIDGLEYETNKTYTLINIDILMNIIEENERDKFKTEFENLLNNFKNRSHIEIERKFILNDIKFEEIINYFKKNKMEIVDEYENYQFDKYYDDNEILNDANISFRVREKSNEKYITIKMPTNNSNKTERFEYEERIDGVDDTIIDGFEKKYISEDLYSQIKKLDVVIQIKNSRKTVNIKKGEVEYEVSYDNIIYCDKYGKEIRRENELEIELKSNYYHRVHLKLLGDDLSKNYKGLKENKYSKYQRGIRYMKEKNLEENI